jgi:E3 ubiquitin-protein ligase DOA10
LLLALQVCKHKFSFTPVYASNAPSKLPWHEVLLGACKRALRGIKVAHRVRTPEKQQQQQQ